MPGGEVQEIDLIRVNLKAQTGLNLFGNYSPRLAGGSSTAYPKLDGNAFARKAKTNLHFKDIPMIAIFGRAGVWILKTYLLMGVTT